MKRITLTLTDEEYAALEQQAQAERRSVRGMAAYLVTKPQGWTVRPDWTWYPHQTLPPIGTSPPKCSRCGVYIANGALHFCSTALLATTHTTDNTSGIN